MSWRLVTHSPERIVRWALSDDEEWLRIQFIRLPADESVTEAKVRTVSIMRSELQRILAGINVLEEV